MRSPPDEQSKEAIIEMIGHLIHILRQVLTCIREERTALFRQEWTTLESVLARRHELIQTSTPLIDRLIGMIQPLTNGTLEACSLLDGLIWLRENAPADAIDLHLYAGQLSVIATEIRQQTRSLLAALESHPTDSAPAQKYLTRLEARPVKSALLVADADDSAE